MSKSSFLFILISVFLLSSCQDSILKGDIKVSIKETRPRIDRVKIQNDQLIVIGTNLDTVILAKVEGSINHSFNIESRSSNQLILNAKNAISFLVGQSLNLIVSNASAAASFPVSFELQNGQVTAQKLHHMGAAVGQYLRFNGTTWAPASISSSQIFAGSYDASSNVPDISLVGGSSGTYYIVTIAGTQDLGSGPETLAVGDWVIYNGTSWSRIAIGTNTVSGFNGRTGLVVPLADDYSWSMLTKAAGKLAGSKLQEIADVNVTGIQDGDILQWNNSSSNWEAAPYPTFSISTGSITNSHIANSSIDSSKISDGSITNADVSGTAAIAQSKIANLTNDLNGKEPTIPSGTNLEYVRGDKTLGTLSTTVVPEGSNLYFTDDRVRATTLFGYTATAASPITALDTIPQAIGKLESYVNSFSAASGSYVLLNGTSAMSGNLNLNSHKIMNVTDPTNPGDVATKNYVDGVASPWVKSGSNISYSAGRVGIGNASPAEALDVLGNITVSGGVHYQSNTSNYIELKAPSGLVSTFSLNLPSTTGSPNQLLTTDGFGNLSWITPPSTTPTGAAGGDLSGTYPNPIITALSATKIGSGSVDNTELGYLDGVTSNIQTQLTEKIGTATTFTGDVSGAYNATSVDKIKGSPIALASMVSGNVLRFNGTDWVNAMLGASDITSGVLPVSRGGTNLGSLSGDRMMLSTPTGLVEASALTNGQLFIGSTGNSPVAATLTAGTGVSITNSAGGITINATGTGGTVTNVTGNAPINVATGATTPVVSISQATTSADGYLSSADWNIFNNKQAPLSSGTTINNVTYPASGAQNLQVSNAPVNLTDVVNKQYVDGFGLWGINSGNVYRASGNVGIGTSTPGQMLSVAGIIETTSGGVKFPDGTTQTTAFTGSSGSAQYDSGWQTASPGSMYTFTHGLGTTPLKVTVLAKDNATGKIIQLSPQAAYGYSDWGGLASVTMDSTYIRIGTAANRYGSYINDGLLGVGMNFATATMRVLAWTSGDGPASIWSSSGTSAYYNGGNVGIGTTAPAEKLEVSGSIKIVDGNQGVGKVLTSDANGKASWQTFSVGRTSCPAGFTLIGTSGSAETFCISTNQETTTTWLGANQTCRAKSPKARLCSASEWAAACVDGAAGPNNMTGHWEWVADLYFDNGQLMGNAGCNSFAIAPVGNTYGSRCCFR